MKKRALQSSQFLTAQKIKQVMAGYKANYNRCINAARSISERKALLMAKEPFLANKMSEIIKHNSSIKH